MAMVRFLARKARLAGKTELESVHADIIVEHCNDFMAKLVSISFPKIDREEFVSSFLSDFFPGWLDMAESFLKKRGGIWFNGSSLSFGDLAMMVFLTYLTHPEEKSFTGRNNEDATANLQRVREVDEIALYLRTRPAFKVL